jgi:hypothetical protein
MKKNLDSQEILKPNLIPNKRVPRKKMIVKKHGNEEGEKTKKKSHCVIKKYGLKLKHKIKKTMKEREKKKEKTKG